MTRLGAVASRGSNLVRDAILADANTGRMLRYAEDGNGEACHALGVAYSTGTECSRDLIEAHKWFNLAATYGCDEGGFCRADISLEMTSGQIAEAQRRARTWLSACRRHAA